MPDYKQPEHKAGEGLHKPDHDYGKPEHPVAEKVVKDTVKEAAKEKALADEKAAAEQAVLLNNIGRILRQFDGESNVPIHHEYWAMIAKYRSAVQ